MTREQQARVVKCWEIAPASDAQTIQDETELGHRFLADSADLTTFTKLVAVDLRTTEVFGGGLR